ncbi:MAG: SOS response-associated peptidase [Anaerolineaceae bacterium]|nr:SOS response-associated peptidase [Anaerolineaceae bacterium]
MCGRFTITLDALEFQKELQRGETPSDWLARFNIAPAQPVAVVTDSAARAVIMMRWGLIPSWATDPAIGNRMINARAETVTIKPAFRRAFEQQRCVILADGFYEWKQSGDKNSPKTPYYFYLNGHKPFVFAGLWEVWKSPENEKVYSCTIITCPANSVVGAVHNRMPVILNRKDAWDWLEPHPATDLKNLLRPYPDVEMDAHPVSRVVNRPENDRLECILPVAE